MAKVLATLAQYNDEDEVRERAIVIMNSFVWQVGLIHIPTFQVDVLNGPFQDCKFSSPENDLI